ncbi:MAG TPA: hypothetical protein VG711_08030 [Phycisphaerales bacterium]|nr:hypothetical protein [Phycisphaerales bacterium]
MLDVMRASGIIKRIVLFLSIGLLSTVMITWGCAVLIDVSGARDTSYRNGVYVSDSKPPYWLITYYRCPGAQRYYFDGALNSVDFQGGVRTKITPMPEWITLKDVIPAGPEIDPQTRRARLFHTEDARGWPWLAACCNVEIIVPPTLPMQFNAIVEGGLPARAPALTFSPTWLEIRHQLNTYRMLPYRPIPLGFIADSVLYAVSAFLLYHLYCFLRTLIRRMWGLCPKCAYNLRASGIHHANCPECGTSVKNAQAPQHIGP